MMKKTVLVLTTFFSLMATSPTFATPLNDALVKTDFERVHTLIIQGADVNEKDEQGATPLFLLSVMLFNAEKNLAEKDFERTGPSEKWQDLKLKLIDAATLLVEKGADVNTKIGGASPIHFAAQAGTIDFVRLLIKNGVDINVKTEEGETPLRLAIQSKHTYCAQIIKAAGGVE